MPQEPFISPSSVQAVDGEVTVVGPDHNGMSLTPDAAEATALHLLAEAARARRQSASLTPEQTAHMAAQARRLASSATSPLREELLRLAAEIEAPDPDSADR